MNHVASKKELFVTNVKVFYHLTVVEKRVDLDVSGYLNPSGIGKLFTSVAGFLKPLTYLAGFLKLFTNVAASLKPFTNVAMWQEF